ncbi:DUF397 domain-containing protein [Micromonospora sagamiensis]|uniref:Uncharacterized protein DUF397 n=1 Tax=Micromonospora sagamiensis TaxID=47875 RepID=A0A562WKF9_9ACTN|nr:DUF397 domain-containing protein [Micromonospora sagamiensis]TWJ30783.1 uncharacterized protein DUF397 [Micromonospora sagamiensis]BCL16181.1 hypothetical protein GCM10017556_39200 [Micromonospora sagamiensis]
MTPTAHPALATARWRKSSHSGDEGACVEVAVVRDPTDTVAVRDSKDPHGPVLRFPPTAWAAFAGAPPAPPAG